MERNGENEKGGLMFRGKKVLIPFAIALLLLFVLSVSGMAQTRPGGSSAGQNPSAIPQSGVTPGTNRPGTIQPGVIPPDSSPNSVTTPNGTYGQVPNSTAPNVNPNSTLPNQNPNMVPNVNPNPTPNVTPPNANPMPRPDATNPNTTNPYGTRPNVTPPNSMRY
jgi:hypothetical protein